jgi:phosphoribosylformylglycinamidine cyclo-ligase
VELRASSWRRPAVFDWLESAGIAPREMHRTFNCGVGMIVIVSPEQVSAALASLAAHGEQATVIGSVIVDAEQAVTIV